MNGASVLQLSINSLPKLVTIDYHVFRHTGCPLYLDYNRIATSWRVATHWLHNVTRVHSAKFIRQEMSHAKGTDYYIVLVGAPILILLGTVGNGLSLAVMLRKALRRSTTSLLLAALAVVDTAVLYVTMLPIWLDVEFDISLSDASPVTCKLYPLASYVFSQFSPWIIVLVAVERLIVVFVPHKAHLLLTRRRVATSIAVTGCTLVVANLHVLWMLTYNDTEERCANRWRDVYWQVRVFPILNAVLSSFLPATMLAVSNVLILVKIARERRHVSGQRPMRRTGITTMLVTASVVFVVTTVPVQIFYLTYRNLKHEVAEIAGKYVYLLVCINYVINFLLYCISGSRFRREVIVMLTCRAGTQSTATVNTHHTYSRPTELQAITVMDSGTTWLLRAKLRTSS